MAARGWRAHRAAEGGILERSSAGIFATANAADGRNDLWKSPAAETAGVTYFAGISAFDSRGIIWSALAIVQTADAISVAACFTSSGTMRS
jgi:hypothetical protein